MYSKMTCPTYSSYPDQRLNVVLPSAPKPHILSLPSLLQEKGLDRNKDFSFKTLSLGPGARSTSRDNRLHFPQTHKTSALQCIFQTDILPTVKASYGDAHFSLRLGPLFWKIPPTLEEASASASPWVPLHDPYRPLEFSAAVLFGVRMFCGALYSSRSPSTHC